jgi:competence protein ComEC
MKSVVTRFRAYQLGESGSSFSFFAGGHFTIIEGRLTDLSRRSFVQEMTTCNVDRADTLHITSWDRDHCCPDELQDLLDLARPLRIECPGYQSHSDCGIDCLKIIQHYRLMSGSNREVEVKSITPEYIERLSEAQELGFKDIFYNPLAIDECCANNNSTIKFFRKGSSNVLSCGDVESHLISARLRNSRSLCRELDLLILAHHGASNGFTNKSLS